MTDMKYDLYKAIMKKSTLQNRNHKELTDDEFHEMMEEKRNPLLVINKLTNDEVRELIREINNPLLHLYEGGYREYSNEIDWNCHFCGKKIERNEGYWGGKQMRQSEGTKSCHKCFLKFLLMMEDNDYLKLLFEKIRGKELKIFETSFSK